MRQYLRLVNISVQDGVLLLGKRAIVSCVDPVVGLVGVGSGHSRLGLLVMVLPKLELFDGADFAPNSLLEGHVVAGRCELLGSHLFYLYTGNTLLS